MSKWQVLVEETTIPGVVNGDSGILLDAAFHFRVSAAEWLGDRPSWSALQRCTSAAMA